MQIQEWIEDRCGVIGSDRPATLLAIGAKADRLVRLCWETPPAGPPTLMVQAHTVADAVWSAGGLICDVALSGWDVVVQTADRSTPRALRILGAGVIPPDPHNDCWTAPQRPRRDDGEVRHVPSAAALAFKARATELVSPGSCATGVEIFRVVSELA